MKTNPFLEEIWRTKDELAREAGYDLHRFITELRSWSALNPHSGLVLGSLADLRELAAKEERERVLRASPSLHDEPPKGSGS